MSALALAALVLAPSILCGVAGVIAACHAHYGWAVGFLVLALMGANVRIKTQ